MKTADLLNSLDIADVLKILSKDIDTDLQMYIDYFNGKQAIENREPGKDVNRLVFNYAKIIPSFAAAFIFAEKPTLLLNNTSPENETLFTKFVEKYNESKADSYHYQIAEEVFAYGKVAALITQNNGDINYTVISVKTNKIFANFDNTGALDSFLRIYTIPEIIGNEVKNVTYSELYLTSEMRRFQSYESGVVTEITGTKYSKMPVVYYSIDKPLFEEVKTLLDRYNLIMSSNGDANDYFGNPLLKIKGRLVKNEKGKTSLDKNSINSVHIEDYDNGDKLLSSDIDYLKRDSKPEAIIYETETLKNNILYLTSTADISFSNLKGLGFPSGFALEMIFLNSIIASKTRQPVFFHLSREINIMKNILTEITGSNYNQLSISVQFNSPLPRNYENIIKELSMSFNSNILSQETAVNRNPYVTDADGEMKRIKESETSESFEI